jgi:hypothetical protein
LSAEAALQVLVEADALTDLGELGLHSTLAATLVREGEGEGEGEREGKGEGEREGKGEGEREGKGEGESVSSLHSSVPAKELS